MKREYLAIAVGSLLILAPSALAQDAGTAGGEINNPRTTFTYENPFDKYLRNSVNTEIKSSPRDAIYKGARTPMVPPAPADAPSDGDAPGSAPPAAEISAPPTSQFAIGTRVPLQFRSKSDVAPAAALVAQPVEAPAAPAAPPVVEAAQDPSAPGAAPYDPSDANAAQGSRQIPVLDPAPAPASVQSCSACAQTIAASSEPILPEASMSNDSCPNYDKRGTEGLLEKGDRRRQKMDDILRDMRHRTEMVNSAEAGSVSRLNRKDATVRTTAEKNAKCEMVIPGEMSGGFIGLEAEYGAGAYKCRNSKGDWEDNYHYVQLKGGNIGFQLGGKKTDRVLFFMNDSAVEKLQNLDKNVNKIKVAARAGIDVGPYGRDASVATGWNLHDDIRSYSDSEGLYVGVSLEGAVIHPDRNMDAVMSGGHVTKHKHNWGFIHWGRRSICEAMSDNQQGNQAQYTSDDSMPGNQSVQAQAPQQPPAPQQAGCAVQQ